MDRAETTALLLAARGGSPEALDLLFRRHAGRLLALIRVRMGRRLRAHLESGDILNASLLKAFQNIESFRRAEGASLMAWLARIAENEIRDQAAFHARQRRDGGRIVRPEEGLDGLAARLRTQSSRLVLEERTSALTEALEELDEAHREVILLRRFEELSFAEIGARMQRSPDACRMLLARAMAALTVKLQERE